MGPKTTVTRGKSIANAPSLYDPTVNLLQTFLAGAGNQPSPFSRTNGATIGMQGGGLYNSAQALLGGPQLPGMDVLQRLAQTNPGEADIAAYQPLFQRNLAEATNVGPRFSSANDAMRARALADFGVLAQNVFAQRRGIQLGAAQSLAQTGLGQQGINADQIRYLLQLAGQAGGLTTAPVVSQSKGLFGQLLGVAAPIAGALLGGPAGAAAGSAVANGVSGGWDPTTLGGGAAGPSGNAGGVNWDPSTFGF